MMFQAKLKNRAHPEHGVVTVPFPLHRDNYSHYIRLTKTLEIGSATERDCWVNEIDGAWPVLERLENTQVNLDDLDYLAKRLDSFDIGEAAQFQAMAEKLDLHDMKDFINLTFCCQQATVITDFSDLGGAGRDHYMNLHGGCASTEEINALDGYKTARQLIASGDGIVTQYGVVYDNGMEMSQLYDGKHLPAYLFEPDLMMVSLSSKSEPGDTKNITWLYFPAAIEQIDRAILRSGITDPEDMRFRFGDSQFPTEIDAALDFEQESIYELNKLALAVSILSQQGLAKLGAVVSMAQPETASQVRHLAENLDQFDFVPGAHTPAEYGKYMIQESGRFVYDKKLESFYNYEQYGIQRMDQEEGVFTDRGYISYHGTLSLDELMMEDPAEEYQKEQDLQMGGMS